MFLLQELDPDPDSIRMIIAATSLIVVLASLIAAIITLAVATYTRGTISMATKGTNNAKQQRTNSSTADHGEDFLAGEFTGEFAEISEQLAANLGTIAKLAVIGGGYFGISVSDDGVTSRLVIRRGAMATDRRFYRTSDLEHALAVALKKLAER